MSSLELLARQPDFPNEDLHKKNIAMVEYYLQEEHTDRALAKHLQESMRMVHVVAHQALSIVGVKAEYSQVEYEAFCGGFAAFEYVSLLVNPRMVSGALAIKNTQQLLIEPGELADFSMADRHQPWAQAFPNTYGVIVDTGARRGETMNELQLRAIGAQVASELEMAA